MRFEEQTVLLTGASSGIGRELAKQLADLGCKVGLVARREELLCELADEIRQAGGTVAFARADVADRPTLRDAVAALEKELGPVDLLIANAGVSFPVTLEPFNIDEIETVIRVNLMGVINSIDAVLPGMLERGRGHLSAVASLGGYRGYPHESAYTCSKAAVINFLEGLRIQLRGRGVDVTTISPGFVTTPMTASHDFYMPALMNADEAARRIIRALRKRKKVFRFPWLTSFLTRLARWAPDWLIARLTPMGKGEAKGTTTPRP